MKKQVYILVVLLFGCILSINAQTKEEKKQQKKENIKTLVEQGDFKIIVSTALPRSSSAVNLNSPFSTMVKNDSIYSHLPYYGRAYSVPYSGGKGLNFDSTINKYEVSKGKKEELIVKLDTDNDEDRYRYVFTIHPNGTANISVTMINRASISYIGRIEIDE